MRIIEPSYKIEDCPGREEVLRRIEEAGRTCYKSEDRITEDSGAVFVKMVLERGHESVIEHVSMTVRFVCNRGVTHEMVRHRLAAYSQESTRYCNYSKGKHDNQITIINDGYEGEKLDVWMKVIETCEWGYMRLLELGEKPQKARNLLPIALKTEIVMTANIREWRHVFRLRCSPLAHPQMRELMIPLLKDVAKRLPEIFGGKFEEEVLGS